MNAPLGILSSLALWAGIVGAVAVLNGVIAALVILGIGMGVMVIWGLALQIAVGVHRYRLQSGMVFDLCPACGKEIRVSPHPNPLCLKCQKRAAAIATNDLRRMLLRCPLCSLAHFPETYCTKHGRPPYLGPTEVEILGETLRLLANPDSPVVKDWGNRIVQK